MRQIPVCHATSAAPAGSATSTQRKVDLTNGEAIYTSPACFLIHVCVLTLVLRYGLDEYAQEAVVVLKAAIAKDMDSNVLNADTS